MAVNERREIVGLAEINRPPRNHLYRENATVSTVVADGYQDAELDSALLQKVMEVSLEMWLQIMASEFLAIFRFKSCLTVVVY